MKILNIKPLFYQLKCVIDKNSDKYLAKASLDKLKNSYTNRFRQTI